MRYAKAAHLPIFPFPRYRLNILMSFILCCSFGAFMEEGSKGTKFYKVPKYSPSYKRSSRDIGPRPGSKVKGGQSSETFKRIYNNPAEARLLVRVPCGVRVGRGQLIAKAKELTTPRGPVVQVDWDTIRKDQKVSFWLVSSAQRKIVTVEMDGRDGTYKKSASNDEAQMHWEAQRLIISPAACVKEKDLTSKDMRIAVINALNRFSVDFFRRASSRKN